MPVTAGSLRSAEDKTDSSYSIVSSVSFVKYKPNWKSLDSRPLPEWFDDAKIGIFIHWGVFSFPGINAWLWYNWRTQKDPAVVQYMEKNYKPDFTYPDFAPEFTAEFFKPDQWTDLFQASGAK